MSSSKDQMIAIALPMLLQMFGNMMNRQAAPVAPPPPSYPPANVPPGNFPAFPGYQLPQVPDQSAVIAQLQQQNQMLQQQLQMLQAMISQLIPMPASPIATPVAPPAQ